jgi:hypothetical protein
VDNLFNTFKYISIFFNIFWFKKIFLIYIIRMRLTDKYDFDIRKLKTISDVNKFRTSHIYERLNNLLEPDTIELLNMLTEYNFKDVLKLIKPPKDAYIIINNNIYHRLKCNELFNIIQNIKNERKYFSSWSLIWQLQFFTYEEALQKLMDNPNTVFKTFKK